MEFKSICWINLTRFVYNRFINNSLMFNYVASIILLWTSWERLMHSQMMTNTRRRRRNMFTELMRLR